MAYIQKNVNFLLILLFLAVVTAFIGFTTYYQTTYRNLSSEYNERVTELESAQNNISLQDANIRETATELQLRVADKTKFENLYTELVAEKNKLDKDLAQTRGSLASSQSELATTKSELGTAKTDLSKTKDDLENALSRESSLRSELNALCVKAKAADPEISC